MAGLETYNTPEKLKSFLQELLSHKKLPTHKGKVARSFIEKKYGFQHCSLSNYHGFDKYQWCKDVVDDFEKELIEKEAGNITGVNSEYGTPKRFKKLLDKLKGDIDSLPVAPQGDRAGRISFRSFERKFKFPTYSLVGRTESWQWARDMLNEFDEELYEQGMIGTVWERKVPAIRKYLEELDKNQELPINERGKLNRKSVMSEFGLAANQSTSVAETRAPKLKELFREYDEFISEQDYSQYAGDKHKDALLEILENKELVLDSSSRVISIKWLAQELDIEKNTIRTSPNLMKLIEKRTQKLHQTQQRGLTKKSFTVYGAAMLNLGATPYFEKHGRVYSFSSLIELYSLEFAEKVGTAFIVISNKAATGTVKNKYIRILHFFEWLANPKNIDRNVADLLRDNKKVKQADFGKACMAYRAELLLENPSINLNTFIITQFGDARVLPKYTFLTRGKAKKDRSHRQSILEASIKKDELERVEEILTDAAKYRGIKISEGKDTKAFLETLMFEKVNKPDLPDDLPKAMLEITELRLLEIRIQASKVFKQWQMLHKEGVELLELATVDCNEFRLMLEKRVSISSFQWSQYIKDIFPIDDKQLALANLLAVIKTVYNSCPPNVATTNMQMWNKKYQLFGGIERVASYLIPTRKAISSALTLYLCESGANVAVALTLSNDCVRKSSVAQHKKVVGKKDRSFGKPIYDDLAVKSDNAEYVSAVNALEYICSAQPETDDDTLQYYQKGAVQPLTEFAFRDEFKAICNHSDYLKQFRLVPLMLRPTVLLNVQLKDPANLGVAQLIAQHESGATTEGYTNKLPHRIQMEKDMLEFQQTIEVVMIYDDEETHKKLNMTQKQWNEKKQKVEKTGWGIFCKDREIVTESGEKFKCGEVENCVKCKHDRMLVSADPISISDMIIWKAALDNKETEFTAKNMNRWTDVWVPWQAFFTVVLEEKMTRGKLSVIKKKATEIAGQKMSDSDFTMPEPW
ncbi:hypothetical protein EU508_10835 [Pseudoalteromonas fuliginea]|uniref:Uncharacterized protein n=1 Tax=Pseudoalteromonas fuliginea TaxID=1872678 RepID=A0AB73BGU7_9GAMM|nr:hypothetical protein [Pseudoalteromonas fuliginea]KAA1160229.1 hypothetical protein EU508_10835 [Pseudoalteromonas fuliginea]